MKDISSNNYILNYKKILENMFEESIKRLIEEPLHAALTIIIGLSVASILYYIVYLRIIRMYYLYWYYTRQGIPCVGFPLPVIGNLNLFLKALYGMNAKSRTPLEDYFDNIYPPGTKMPPIFLDMRDHRGIVVVTDPTYVDELYVAKNRFFEKADKERDAYFRWFGDSFFYAKSDKRWQE